MLTSLFRKGLLLAVLVLPAVGPAFAQSFSRDNLLNPSATLSAGLPDNWVLGTATPDRVTATTIACPGSTHFPGGLPVYSIATQGNAKWDLRGVGNPAEYNTYHTYEIAVVLKTRGLCELVPEGGKRLEQSLHLGMEGWGGGVPVDDGLASAARKAQDSNWTVLRIKFYPTQYTQFVPHLWLGGGGGQVFIYKFYYGEVGTTGQAEQDVEWLRQDAINPPPTLNLPAIEDNNAGALPRNWVLFKANPPLSGPEMERALNCVFVEQAGKKFLALSERQGLGTGHDWYLGPETYYPFITAAETTDAHYHGGEVYEFTAIVAGRGIGLLGPANGVFSMGLNHGYINSVGAKAGGGEVDVPLPRGDFNWRKLSVRFKMPDHNDGANNGKPFIMPYFKGTGVSGELFVLAASMHRVDDARLDGGKPLIDEPVSNAAAFSHPNGLVTEDGTPTLKLPWPNRVAPIPRHNVPGMYLATNESFASAGWKMKNAETGAGGPPVAYTGQVPNAGTELGYMDIRDIGLEAMSGTNPERFSLTSELPEDKNNDNELDPHLIRIYDGDATSAGKDWHIEFQFKHTVGVKLDGDAPNLARVEIIPYNSAGDKITSPNLSQFIIGSVVTSTALPGNGLSTGGWIGYGANFTIVDQLVPDIANDVAYVKIAIHYSSVNNAFTAGFVGDRNLLLANFNILPGSILAGNLPVASLTTPLAPPFQVSQGAYNTTPLGYAFNVGLEESPTHQDTYIDVEQEPGFSRPYAAIRNYTTEPWRLETAWGVAIPVEANPEPENPNDPPLPSRGYRLAVVLQNNGVGIGLKHEGHLKAIVHVLDENRNWIDNADYHYSWKKTANPDFIQPVSGTKTDAQTVYFDFDVPSDGTQGTQRARYVTFSLQLDGGGETFIHYLDIIPGAATAPAFTFTKLPAAGPNVFTIYHGRDNEWTDQLEFYSRRGYREKLRRISVENRRAAHVLSGISIDNGDKAPTTDGRIPINPYGLYKAGETIRWSFNRGHFTAGQGREHLFALLGSFTDKVYVRRNEEAVAVAGPLSINPGDEATYPYVEYTPPVGKPGYYELVIDKTQVPEDTRVIDDPVNPGLEPVPYPGYEYFARSGVYVRAAELGENLAADDSYLTTVKGHAGIQDRLFTAYCDPKYGYYGEDCGDWSFLYRSLGITMERPLHYNMLKDNARQVPAAGDLPALYSSISNRTDWHAGDEPPRPLMRCSPVTVGCTTITGPWTADYRLSLKDPAAQGVIELWNEPHNEQVLDGSSDKLTAFQQMYHATFTALNPIHPVVRKLRKLALNMEMPYQYYTEFENHDVEANGYTGETRKAKDIYDVVAAHPYASLGVQRPIGPEHYSDGARDLYSNQFYYKQVSNIRDFSDYKYVAETANPTIRYTPGVDSPFSGGEPREDANGDPAPKEVISTEFGWFTSDDDELHGDGYVSLEKQAHFTVRSALLQLASGFDKVTPWTFWDWDSKTTKTDVYRHAGMADGNRKPKPALAAYTFFAHLTNNMVYAGNFLNYKDRTKRKVGAYAFTEKPGNYSDITPHLAAPPGRVTSFIAVYKPFTGNESSIINLPAGKYVPYNLYGTRIGDDSQVITIGSAQNVDISGLVNTYGFVYLISDNVDSADLDGVMWNISDNMTYTPGQRASFEDFLPNADD